MLMLAQMEVAVPKMVINASHVMKSDILGPPPFETPQIGTYRTSSVCE
jgi:hypothetical protein